MHESVQYLEKSLMHFDCNATFQDITALVYAQLLRA